MMNFNFGWNYVQEFIIYPKVNFRQNVMNETSFFLQVSMKFTENATPNIHEIFLVYKRVYMVHQMSQDLS